MTLHKNYRILHRVLRFVSTSTFLITATFKSFVKQNIHYNKTYKYAHDLLLCQTKFVSVKRFTSCLHETKYKF
jgi:hypothetical protein